jgi:exocyst complex component 2
MAESSYERTILEHYHLSTPYPDRWPEENDTSDVSDAEEDEPQTLKATSRKIMRRSVSKYSALERVTSDRRSVVPGIQKTGDGVDNLVQRDEPDPLGSTESVVRILRTLNLPIQDDASLRRCLAQYRTKQS